MVFKRLIAGALCALLLLGALPARGAGAPPSTAASAAVLMDAGSGRVLYAQNADARLPIASITKLMTALVAAELGDLDREVVVDPQAAGVEGSSMYLQAGERLTLRDLLYGLLLRSGNDAAVAIAVACAGDVDAFVHRMNRKAHDLGLRNTHFANPNGLDAPEHYSSARDMARIAQAALADPDVAQIAATRSITLGVRTLVNHNKLLWRYPGCIGLKTGYTDSAGRTLVSAAQREGLTLICVTLHDPNDWADHTALLDYGFAHYRRETLTSAGDVLGALPVRGSLVPRVEITAARDLSLCLGAGETAVCRPVLPRCLEAPVAAGDVVGQLCYTVNGQDVAQVDLVAAAPAPPDRPDGLRDLLAPVARSYFSAKR